MAEDTIRALQARPIPVAKAAPPASTQTTLLVAALAVASLYIGRDLLMPMALSILLAFVLTPIVTRLQRWRLGRVPSVLAVVALVFIGIGAFGLVVGSQIADLANNLPTYERNLRAKIQSVRATANPAGGGVIQEVSKVVRDLRDELARTTAAPPGADAPDRKAPGAPATTPSTAAEPEPVPVRVQSDAPTPLEVLSEMLGPVVAPLATAGMVLVFTIFMLLQREDLRDRLIRLAGSGDLSRTTEAMNDAGQRVSRYLLMQVVVNVTYGLPIGLGLWLLGVPNPVLWGMLATVLRFIPFVGPAIAASFPILLSFAVDPGWTLPLLTVALFVAVELFSNNVAEPWLYGSATGLSSLAIIVAALFWTALWGPVGLLLATPLTVCLVVLGRHVPQMHFLEVLLGDRPVLPDEAKIYQRLLARDPDEAAEIVEGRLADGDLPDLCDHVLLPALSLAEQDRQRGTLNPEGRQAVAEGMAALLEDLGEPGGAPADDRTAPDAPLVLCVGARNDLDEAAAALLARLLPRHGARADVIPAETVSARAVASLGTSGVTAIALSYLNPSALPHARRTVRRLRLHFGPKVPIVLCLWSAHPEAGATEQAIARTGADRAVTNLAGALAELADLGAAGDGPAEAAEAVQGA